MKAMFESLRTKSYLCLFTGRSRHKGPGYPRTQRKQPASTHRDFYEAVLQPEGHGPTGDPQLLSGAS